MFREPSIGRYYTEAPQLAGKGVRSWITRGANFAIMVSVGEAGASFSGTAQDEQFAYALEGGVRVTAGNASETLGVEDLAILPPGAWTMHFEQAGHVVQQITADEPLAKHAANAANYADGAPEVARTAPWPEPVGGYRLRRYSTLEAYARGGMVHAFRTRKLMMVPYARFLQPRDETQLSPHSHADFEQGSVALEGEWLHHLRVPWTPDKRTWRPDVHLLIGSPSTTIIPAGVIHTSQGIAGEGMRLVDVFAPPRMDFSERGWVDNAADYPMPGASLMSQAVREWVARFEATLAAPSSADLGALFGEECYWRDFVAFTWNIITLEGRAAIAAMLGKQAARISATSFAAADTVLPMSDETQGWFTFSTATARCRGHVQLRDGKAYVLVTAMLELIGFEETGGARRPDGIAHRAEKGRRTWLDGREETARTLGHTEEPYCLIVGGGHNGLMLAARLKRLGVPTLVIDALEKPGDGWRARYRSLYLHDPVFLDHFPYLPFPDHWPLYTSKDKIAEWLEIYARAMEIDFWGSARCTAARHDAKSGDWVVTVLRDGDTLTLRPKQLVLATGLSGVKHIPAIPGAQDFSGRQYHSADHGSGAGLEGKRCVVIGSNNSAHDICVDLWEHDAEVTMIQRSPTIVVRADTMGAVAKGIYYAQPGADMDLADLMFAANPFGPRTAFEKGFTDYLRKLDAEFYTRLAGSGFNVWHGEDETGFFMAYYRRAAGYYIDVGGSELIISGQIPVRQGEVVAITADGVRMADGELLSADVIIYATGYRPMSEFVGQLISPEVQRKVGPCWGLGSGTEGDPGPWEGELRNMWKPTAQEALWFQGGNLMQARFHSLHLALQLKARMEGLPTPVYRRAP